MQQAETMYVIRPSSLTFKSSVMKSNPNVENPAQKEDAGEHSKKRLKNKRKKKQGLRNAIDRARNHLIHMWGGQLPARDEVERFYFERDLLTKNISVLLPPNKQELIKAKKCGEASCLMYAAKSIKEVANPAPYVSFGFMSKVFSIELNDGYHQPDMLYLPLDAELLKLVYPESIKVFKWDDNLGYSPVPMSGVDVKNAISWARIMDAGIYVAIGLTKIPRLKGFIQNFQNIKKLDMGFENGSVVESFINSYLSFNKTSDDSEKNTSVDDGTKYNDQADAQSEKKRDGIEIEIADRITQFSKNIHVPGLFPETRLDGSESWWEKQYPVVHHKWPSGITYLRRSKWTNVGPSNITCVIVCLAIHPIDSNILYAGSEFGGVFKTYDRGGTWIPMMEKEPNLSIYSIAVSKSNPMIVYAGGLDFFYTKEAVFYKSVDGGYSWKVIPLLGTNHVKAIEVDPLNSDIVYVASNSYLFKSVNGGETWLEANEITVNDVKEYTHHQFSGDIWDVKLDPQHSSTVYISVKNRGVFKTLDGRNWRRIGWRYNFDVINDEEQPRTIVGKLDGTYRTVLSIGNDNRPGKHGSQLVVAKTQGTILYSTVGGEESIVEWTLGIGPNLTPQPQREVSWKVLSSNMAFSSQSFWCSCVAVCPTNEDFIVAGGYGIEFVKDWNSKPVGLQDSLHPDQQQIVFCSSGNGDFYFCNDGHIGLATSYGANVEKISDGLIASQIIHLAISQSSEMVIAATTFHTGTIRSGRINPEIWEGIDGPELGTIAIDPQNPEIFLSSPGGGPVAQQPLRRSTTGGKVWRSVTQYAAPWCIEFHPLLPERMIVAASSVQGQVLFSVDRGLSWHVVENSLNQPLDFGDGLFVFSWAESTVFRGFLGTLIGRLWGFFVPGVWQSWSEINTPVPASPPGSWDGISAVCAHPTDGSVYIGYSTTKHRTLFHGRPLGQGTYVWTDIGGLYASISLPQAPVKSIILDPWNLQRIFVATIVGVFVSEDHGSSWRYLNFGIPNVDITSMKLHKPTRKLVLATWGRGIFISDFEVGEYFNA